MNSTNVRVRLAHRVAVYVPGTNGLTELSDNSYHVGAISGYLTDWFGGATIVSGEGAYRADNGTLVREPVKIVYAFAETLTDAQIDSVIGLALALKKTLEQECVAIEIDSELLLVE